MEVEGIKCRLAKNIDEIKRIFEDGDVPLIIDEKCEILDEIKPIALIDAIIAKKNIGTNKNMAPITIALGPGFYAGKDVDAVIETKRGHYIRRLCSKKHGNTRRYKGIFQRKSDTLTGRRSYK